jgi:site-specific DNA recombinase
MATRHPAKPLVLDVYARVSRLGDDRQRSTEGQVKDATARILDRGAEVGEVHIDSGRSAWNPRVRRPGWDRMMERLEAPTQEREAGGVIVWDLARFSRRPIEGERLIAAAEHGLLILDSEGEYDLTSASGKKAFRDQVSTAAYESDRLSTRVKRGKKLAAMRGESPASVRPFGFEADARTPREPEASELRRLVDRLLAGESQDAMVRDLNRRGITTSTGAAWTRASLRRVLNRPRIGGLVEYLGEIVGPMNLDGDPIVPVETFERVAALYGSRRRGRPMSDAYLCSGEAVCGLCEHTLSGRPRAGMRPYADGEPKREYWCQPRPHNGGCGRVVVDQRELDGHVALLVVRILADPQHAAAVEAAARATREALSDVEREIGDCERLIEELDDRLARREIDLKRYDRMVKPLERQAADLQARLEQLRADPEQPGVVSEAEVAASRDEWERRWDDGSVAERRGMIRRALRGRRLLVMPGDRSVPRVFDPERVVIAAPRDAQPAPARRAR